MKAMELKGIPRFRELGAVWSGKTEDANAALAELKASKIRRAKVLRMDE